MNPVNELTFRVADHVPQGRTEFMWADDVKLLETALHMRLRKLGTDAVLAVDFHGVGMSSDAARQFLKTAILRVRDGGEWGDRKLVLTGLGRGFYNIKVMLDSEQIAAVVRGESGELKLVGDVEPAVLETFNFVSKRSSATAKDVQREFDLNTVAAATNRLAKLFKLGAIQRVGQESVEGGGMQYRYASVR